MLLALLTLKALWERNHLFVLCLYSTEHNSVHGHVQGFLVPTRCKWQVILTVAILLTVDLVHHFLSFHMGTACLESQNHRK